MLAVQPLTKQAYTDKGQPYTESNTGKFVAGASVMGATTYYVGKHAVKGAKTLYNKAKTIELHAPKISKEAVKDSINSAKGVAQKIAINAKTTAEKVVKNTKDFMNKDSVKAFIKDIPSNLKKAGKKIAELFKNALDFAKVNFKKINKENLQKVGQSVVNFAKKPSVKYAAGVVAAFAGILAFGYAVDFVVNKVNAKKVDKV